MESLACLFCGCGIPLLLYLGLLGSQIMIDRGREERSADIGSRLRSWEIALHDHSGRRFGSSLV